jgi:ABC-type uncharacterized transport system permease subunit
MIMSHEPHSLDVWFLGSALSFALTSVLYFATHWREETASSASTLLPQRALEITIIYEALLLVCNAIQTGVWGASRLWFGLSALMIAILYRISASRYRLESLGGSLSALATLLALFSYLMRPHTSDPLLIQGWSRGLLIAYISFVIAGLTALAVSAALSSLYLIVERKLKSKQWGFRSASRFPSLSTLDTLNLKGLLIGFPLYTIAIFLGSAYAFQSEGGIKLSYLIALSSWLIYGGVLQARLTAGWRGRRAAILTLIAFLGLLLVAAQYSFR